MFSALLPCLTAASAAAQQIETVTVTASALAGTWKITGRVGKSPNDVPLKLHCRIDLPHAAPAIACFERQNPVLTVEDGKLRIIWSPTLAQSNVIDAQMTSTTSFTASERLRLMGVTVFTSTDLTGTRQEPDPGAPDAAGKAPLMRSLLDQLAKGALSQPYDATKLVVLPKADDLRALGAVTAITYMDHANASDDKKIVPDFFSLYAVDFQNGRRFCGLHQRDDGVIDGFRCA